MPTHMMGYFTQKESKTDNDKTFGFWNDKESVLDNIVFKEWEYAEFRDSNSHNSFLLSPYYQWIYL